MPEQENWTMPEWMEPYRPMLDTTAGGNTIEDLIGRLRDEKNLFRTNVIVYMMALGIDMQVRLLYQLHTAGKLS